MCKKDGSASHGSMVSPLYFNTLATTALLISQASPSTLGPLHVPPHLTLLLNCHMIRLPIIPAALEYYPFKDSMLASS